MCAGARAEHGGKDEAAADSTDEPCCVMLNILQCVDVPPLLGCPEPQQGVCEGLNGVAITQSSDAVIEQTLSGSSEHDATRAASCGELNVNMLAATSVLHAEGEMYFSAAESSFNAPLSNGLRRGDIPELSQDLEREYSKVSGEVRMSRVELEPGRHLRASKRAVSFSERASQLLQLGHCVGSCVDACERKESACESSEKDFVRTLSCESGSACALADSSWSPEPEPKVVSHVGLVPLCETSLVGCGGGRRKRGKGSRARGRVRLRLRRRQNGYGCATGMYIADACRSVQDDSKLAKVHKAQESIRTSLTLSCDAAMCGSWEKAVCPDVSEDHGACQLALVLGRAWCALKVRRRLRATLEKVCVPCVAKPSVNSRKGVTRIELGWCGSHLKRYGKIGNHVKFLQWLFRSVRSISPIGWTPGLPGWVWAVVWICRRTRLTKCLCGKRLAGAEEFKAQRDLANNMLDWYGQYVAVLRGRLSGEAPRFFDNCCGGGLVAEGVRRAGGVPFGIDLEDQPTFKCRFGAQSFQQGDGTDWSLVRGWQKKHRLNYAGASPPCKFYSTARQKGEAKQPPLIERMRDMLQALFDWWWIENVMGAKTALSEKAVEIDGPFFGLRVFRSRLFETSFPLHVDNCVRASADVLRSRCCLGRRNRWRSFDEFGRPYLVPCCDGNVFVPIGESPWRCTLSECAEAMGVDPGHTTYDRLAQGVPPQYSQWVFSQMCMRIAQREFGCPAITFDEMRGNPSKAKRVLAQWLRGAGADAPSAGMSWVRRLEQDGEVADREGVRSLVRVAGAPHVRRVKEDKPWRAPPDVPVRTLKVESHPCPPVVAPAAFCEGEPHAASVPLHVAESGCTADFPLQILDESSFRELYYAHFGGYDCQWSDLGSLPWLGKLIKCTTLEATRIPTVELLVGRNTYLEVSCLALPSVLAVCEEALALGGRGTRMTVVSPLGAGAYPLAWELIDCKETYGGADVLAPQGYKAAWCGKRHGPRRSTTLVHSDVRGSMDAQDLDGFVDDKLAKNELSWTPISHDADLWRGKGLPADVVEIMSEGVKIHMDLDASCFQVPQYPFPDDQSMLESILEADRALTVGHMEYVPDDKIEAVLSENVVHPWLMVWQGKWRLCQDYSSGTNRAASSGPFGLPSAWDARPLLKPGSYMSKYDLRDFFWSIPVHHESRCRLVMRHPGTGRLMWCRSLPFGYLDSPRQACRVSEALAGEMRKRAAGKGIHFLCYVDDYLVIGDDYELSVEGNRIFEEVMSEFGMQWAPAKHRGPVQCLEFLGLLISNVEGHRCIALSEKRQLKLRGMIDDWLRRRPVPGGSACKVEPRDLAKLLGHLVFASQVVPGGRTYMQNMLSSFGGLEVDWKHGRVRAKEGPWDLVCLTTGFWLDLEWWHDHLELRNCMPLVEQERCEAMLAGTDASDWGAGTVVWLDGHKEECNLAFTHAEKRRPINFRELLGIVRVLELYGERLSGCKIMIETDNMAAKGAAIKLASTAASMQEMLRRLYAVAEWYDITVVVIHTPGAKLFRPDQTSRGDPIEEPRLRLNKEEFSILDLRFGPFTEFVGAERRHAISRAGADLCGPRLWLHPAHNTVGSALRLLGERLAGYDGDDLSFRGPPPSGVIVVPYAPEASWWNMTRHFTCVGRWEVGSEHLEMNQLGSWRTVSAKRASLALVFPRAAGGIIAPVELPEGMMTYRADEVSMGYVDAADNVDGKRGKMMPLLAGSFVYSPAEKRGNRGELLLVWHSFHPEIAGRELDEEGELRVSCAELLLLNKRGQRSHEYVLDKREGKNNGSFANGGRQVAWEISVGLLWMVDHLVKVDAALESTVQGIGAASPKLAVAAIEKRKFTFDYVKAEAEIASARAAQVAGPLAKELFPSTPAFTPARSIDQLVALSLHSTDDVSGADAELRAARVSADEAAGLRRRPPPPPTVRKVRRAPVVNNRQPTVCRSSTQVCEGCDGRFKFGEKISTGFRSMVHPSTACLESARQSHSKRVADGREVEHPSGTKGDTCVSAVKECDKIKKVHFAALAEGERLVLVRDCLNGKCTETAETKVMCMRGCGKGLHLVACCRTSAAYAAAGRLICVDCRLKEIVQGGNMRTAPATLVQQVTLAVVGELTTGAVSTAAGRNQFVSLERKWALETFKLGDGSPMMVKLPRHSMESFIAWMWWLVTEAERARSFGTLMRTAGAVMSMLELNDWTKTSRVKAQIKEIEGKCGVEHDPCTQTTRRILSIMLKRTIPEVCSKGKSEYLNSVLIARTEALLVLELLAGLRVGEATSSGDLHGLVANDLCFLSAASEATADGLGETIEVVIRDSKTGLGRHAAFVATTVGELKLHGGMIMRRFLRTTGIKSVKEIKGGFKVESPNFWVARVDLGALTKAAVDRFVSAAEGTRCEVIVEQLASIKKYVKERTSSTSLGVEQRYVNVAGGKKLGKGRYDENLTTAIAWLERVGVGAVTTIVAGPLIRATLGNKLTYMPLATGSTYTHLVGAMKMAYEISSKMSEPDTEFDLQGLEEPKFGNHSLRRHSDKVARESLSKYKRHGWDDVTKEVINYFYGWCLKEMSKDMQLHYAGMDRFARRCLAKVSMFF